jgi:alpha-L-fucosidase
MDSINPYAWQTDTSIGDWFYSEGYKYKTTSEVVHLLTDIVSKNGNLLLNVVQLPDGSLPPEAMTFLTEMAAWMKVNGDAIYGTRPWKIYGEGPTVPKPGSFNEEDTYTAQDIRFTTKGSVLFATTLSSPEKEVRINSLGTSSSYLEKPIKSVKLLGYKQEISWKQENDALVILLPADLPTKHASSFKISF